MKKKKQPGTVGIEVIREIDEDMEKINSEKKHVFTENCILFYNVFFFSFFFSVVFVSLSLREDYKILYHFITANK